MMLTFTFFLTGAAASAVFNQGRPLYPNPPANERVYARAQLRPPRIVNQELPSGVIPLTAAITLGVSFPAITASPDTSSSECTPATICVDAITCGRRYGGCYDRNFCTGTTSYPVPSVNCDFATTAAPEPEATEPPSTTTDEAEAEDSDDPGTSTSADEDN